MFPRFALERGARTIVIFPDDQELQVGIDVQFEPLSVPPFTAFRTLTASTYSDETNLLITARQAPQNSLEYQKIYQQAQSQKP